LIALIVELLMTYSSQHLRENLSRKHRVFKVRNFTGLLSLALSIISFRLTSVNEDVGEYLERDSVVLPVPGNPATGRLLVRDLDL
jgi:uncharacterized membrane protein